MTVVAVGHLGGSAGRRVSVPVRIVAWGAWLVIAVSVIASGLVWAGEGFPPLPLSFAGGPVNVVAVGLISLTTGTVGALLAWRHPANPIGWLLLVEGLGTGFLTPVNLLVGRAFEVAQLWPPHTVFLAWLMSSLLTPVAAAGMILVFFLFPDGRFVGARWRIGGILAVAGPGLLAAASALGPAGLLWYPAVPNPTALPYAYEAAVCALRLTGVAMTVAALLLAGGSMAVRYRHADRRQRLQLRWIVVGVAIMGAAFVPFLVARYVLAVGEGASDLLMGIMALGACSFPLAVAIAIVREHLFEIDEIIWRTLVYVPLTGLLAGLYAASVAFFQRLFISLTGNGSDGAIVISALILAAVFSPARSAIEGRVARRFKPVRRADVHADLGEPMPAPAGQPLVAGGAEADVFATGEPAAAVIVARTAGPAEATGAAETTVQIGAADDRLAALVSRVAALERELVERDADRE